MVSDRERERERESVRRASECASLDPQREKERAESGREQQH